MSCMEDAGRLAALTPRAPLPGISRKPWEAFEGPWPWTLHCFSRVGICGWQGHSLTTRYSGPAVSALLKVSLPKASVSPHRKVRPCGRCPRSPCWTEWNHPRCTFIWAKSSVPWGLWLASQGGHSSLYAQHAATKPWAQDEGQRSADRLLASSLACITQAQPRKPGGSPAWPSSEATPRSVCGCRAADRGRDAANHGQEGLLGRTWGQFSFTERVLPTLGCSFWKAEQCWLWASLFAPPENLLSKTGWMVRMCVLCEFRSETYKPLLLVSP